jgi:hypothetical protein
MQTIKREGIPSIYKCTREVRLFKAHLRVSRLTNDAIPEISDMLFPLTFNDMTASASDGLIFPSLSVSTPCSISAFKKSSSGT